MAEARILGNIKKLSMSRASAERSFQTPPYTINLGVELIAITDVYPLKTGAVSGETDTEYLEIILLKKNFFDKVTGFGDNLLIDTPESI